MHERVQHGDVRWYAPGCGEIELASVIRYGRFGGIDRNDHGGLSGCRSVGHLPPGRGGVSGDRLPDPSSANAAATFANLAAGQPFTEIAADSETPTCRSADASGHRSERAIVSECGDVTLARNRCRASPRQAQ